MSEGVRASAFESDIEYLKQRYPSFDASKTTTAQCYFHNQKWINAIDDLGKIIAEGEWAISYVYYKGDNDAIVRKIDLILRDKNEFVLDVTLYFTQPQAIDNLKLLTQLEYVEIGGIRCSLPGIWKNLNYWFVPEFPAIEYFITLASGCSGSVTTLLKTGFADRANSLTQ